MRKFSKARIAKQDVSRGTLLAAVEKSAFAVFHVERQALVGIIRTGSFQLFHVKHVDGA